METQPKKQCTTCKQDKPLDEFVRYKNKPDGRGSICKPCNRIRLKEYREKNPEAVKFAEFKYRSKNSEKRDQWRRNREARYRALHEASGPSVTEKLCPKCGQVKPADQFARSAETATGLASKCKPCVAEVKRRWREDNPEKAAILDKLQWAKYQVKYSANYKKWLSENRAARNKARMRLHAKRMATDPLYRLAFTIRSRVLSGLLGISKSAPTEVLLGCSFEQCRKHLEAQWEPWMSWENFGEGEGTWQIDHIVPISSFDLADPEQQGLCFHYINLRPLCSKQNRDKWHKFDPASLDDLRRRVLCLSASSLHPPKD